MMNVLKKDVDKKDKKAKKIGTKYDEKKGVTHEFL